MNDLYRFDPAAKEWNLEPNGDIAPPVRSFHAMTSDGERNIYVFGGASSSHYYTCRGNYIFTNDSKC